MTASLTSIPLDIHGHVEVALQDQHTEIIDLFLGQKLSDVTVLVGVTAEDRTIDVSTDGYTPLPEDMLCLKELLAFQQITIKSVASLGVNQFRITLLNPIDYAFTVSGGCSIMNPNMAVDGSVTPVEFKVSPVLLTVGTEWDILRSAYSFLGDGAGIIGNDALPDSSTFGAQNPLENGIVVRHTNGRIKTLFNARTNQQLKIECGGDLEITPANKNGFFGIDARRTFNGQEKNGVTIRLESKVSDSGEFIVIVQDDLREHEKILCNVQGQVVEN
jgi:hypothetical protein